MRKLLLASTALLALSTASNAAIIGNITDPTSSTGLFAQPNAAGFFDDQVLFTLTHAQNFIIAGVQNVFAQPTDKINGFTAAVYNYGPNGIFEGNVAGNGDDGTVIGVTGSVACQLQPNCQIIAGSQAGLAGGLYYVEINGTGGITAAYNGGIATVAVPGPRAGSFTIGSIVALLK